MMSDDRKLKPWERQLKAVLRRRAEREAEAFLADTPENYLSAEELAVQKAKLMERIQAIEAEGESQDATAPSDVPRQEVVSTLSPSLRALLERAGIALVARGHELAIQLNLAAIDLLGGIYEPDAARFRDTEVSLAEDVEAALEGWASVVATRLTVAGDNDLLLNLQWIQLTPEEPPDVQVVFEGKLVLADWRDWEPSDLPKTLRIHADSNAVPLRKRSNTVITTHWDRFRNLLSVSGDVAD